MADFEQAFSHLIDEEGVGLSNLKNDRGGQTFAGIARKFHPEWEGWQFVDAGETPPTQLVRLFYHAEYWKPIQGDQIASQRIADVLFSQYVNMGANAIKLTQKVLGAIADGKAGPKTLELLNAFDEERFLDKFALATLARYYAIGMKDKTQRDFWPGWFGRGLRVAA